MSCRYLLATLLLCVGFQAAAPARARGLPPPAGPVLLTVAGAIGVTNAGGEAVFDRAMLEALGLAKLRTATPWTGPEVVEFEGVPVTRLLDTVRANGDTLHTTAADGYELDLPADDMRKYAVLLALRQDGQELRPEERGPVWIVYPRDQFRGELADETHDGRWVWQLRRIEVR